MKNKKIVVSVLGILGIVLATIGVTYAFFSYSKTGTKENRITSGKVTFLFTEASQGITLTDAMPMTDAEGKAQTGEGKVFDFRVTSSVGTNMRIPYTVTVKQESSVIPAEYIKLYLTDQLDNEIEPVRTLSSLDNYSNTITGLTGEKVLYEGEVQAGNSNYNKLFRLRMWIADNIDMNEGNTGIGTYNGATFSLKVNVYGEGATTTQTEAERRANASVESVTVNGTDVTVVDQTHFEKEIAIGEANSASIPIVVNTTNPNAIVTIDKVDNLGQVVNDNGVKKVSITQNVNVTKGTNYFRIKVRPEDKSEPAIYYLTVIAATSLEPVSFATDDWSTVIRAVRTGNISAYTQELGNDSSVRPVELTFMVNNQEVKETHYLRVANTTSCTDALIENSNLTSETACGFVIEFADIITNMQMNTNKTTIGGYPASLVHEYVNGVVYNALPEEIRNSIVDTTVVTGYNPYDDSCTICGDGRDTAGNYILNNQKLYLFSLSEVEYDNDSLRYFDTAYTTTRFLDYYKTRNNSNASYSVTRIKKNNGTAQSWWLRTPCLSDHGSYWESITSAGNRNGISPTISYGISPAFRIGTATVDSNN